MSTPENSHAVVTHNGTSTSGDHDDMDQQDEMEQQEADQRRINTRLIVILGAALWGLVFGIVFLSVKHESATLPNGLTSLASLIGGGLLAFLNPTHGIIRANSKRRQP